MLTSEPFSSVFITVANLGPPTEGWASGIDTGAEWNCP